ncbi:discoidin domain-containing protein [Streptomyces flavalbus]|uniref:Discoidin domain-containing protein n=1 Tax=Streptomyces flavalbus TaxID=2665155 RepID=A0ABW2W238_9ACTN
MSRSPTPPPRRVRRTAAALTFGALLASCLTLTTAPADAAESLLSQGRRATASSQEGDAFSAAAVDGNLTGTRWASQWRDAEWLQVDLGERRDLSRVVLTWESAYARAYEVWVSDDGTTWRTIHSTTTGDGDVDTINVSATARHVRLHLTARGTGYGYSLYEFGVYA